MPNHVHNIVSLQCDEKLRMEILAHIQDDEKGPGSIDFNKIIPMPESLDMPSGSMEEHAIDMYLTAVNPTTPDYGLPKLPVHVFIVTAQKMNAQRLFGKHEVSLSDEQMRLSADRFRYLEGCES